MRNNERTTPLRQRRVYANMRIGAIVLLVAVALLEGGMRIIPWTPLHPDEMLYVREDFQPVPNAWVPTIVDLRASQSAHAQQTIEAWYVALNHSQVSWRPVTTYCNGMDFIQLTVTFKWRGVAIQSWSSGACGGFFASSGGIPNPFASHSFDVNTPLSAVP